MDGTFFTFRGIIQCCQPVDDRQRPTIDYSPLLPSTRLYQVPNPGATHFSLSAFSARTSLVVPPRLALGPTTTRSSMISLCHVPLQTGPGNGLPNWAIGRQGPRHHCMALRGWVSVCVPPPVLSFFPRIGLLLREPATE